MHHYMQTQNFHAFINAFSQIISCINIYKHKNFKHSCTFKIFHICILKKLSFQAKETRSCVHLSQKETMVVILSTWSRSQLFKKWFVTLSAWLKSRSHISFDKWYKILSISSRCQSFQKVVCDPLSMAKVSISHASYMYSYIVWRIRTCILIQKKKW